MLKLEINTFNLLIFMGTCIPSIQIVGAVPGNGTSIHGVFVIIILHPSIWYTHIIPCK